MNPADPQGSPFDRGGGSSSTPAGVGSQPEVIKVDDSKAVLVITPALVYDMKGEVYALPADIVQAVDHFAVRGGYRRESSRERSSIYSLGVVRRPVRRGGRQTQVLLLGGPHMPQKQDDGSLQERRPQQREHPPQEQKLYTCVMYVGYIQNHTRGIYPGIVGYIQNHTRGIYPGITLQRTYVISV